MAPCTEVVGKVSFFGMAGKGPFRGLFSGRLLFFVVAGLSKRGGSSSKSIDCGTGISSGSDGGGEGKLSTPATLGDKLIA